MVTEAVAVLECPLISIAEVWDRVGKFIREKGLEILMLAILIPGGWKLYGEMGTISERMAVVKVEVSNNARRLDNIAEVLPDLRVRVAYETVNSLIRTAFLLTNAYQVGAKWSANLHVIDFNNNNIVIYRIPVRGMDDKRFKWQLVGGIRDTDSRAIQVKMMEELSVETQDPQLAPQYIDKEYSFVAYQKASRFMESLNAFGALEISRAATPDIQTWPMLIKAIGENKVALLPPPQ